MKKTKKVPFLKQGVFISFIDNETGKQIANKSECVICQQTLQEH